MEMNPSLSANSLPLRWETTGDTWWYASPIDFAAANGQYDLVKELLRLDSDHLLSLTSLRRLRRLESLWDDSDSVKSRSAAESRSAIARRLLRECEINSDMNKSNPLIGGWILYTAAFSGDLEFVKEIIDRNPLLVFGEGEYGLTDMLYAAARSQNPEVFWNLFNLATSPRFASEDEPTGEVPSEFRKEVVNRAVHAAARGGNLVVLMDLLGEDEDGVLSYRDACGSTVLHAAAASGQIEMVKYLITTYDNIISSTDKEGNTALHVAAYKGQLTVVKELLSSSHLSVSVTNNAGNTLLHMAVAGALSPGFQRLDNHIELVKQLTETPNRFRVEEIINSTNNEGRTAIHMAIIGNVHSQLVQHLLAARYINVNVRDNHGMTPLHYLKQQPRSSSSEMLIKKLISVGGMSDFPDNLSKEAIDLYTRMHNATCKSPGTSFRVSDSEIFKHLGIERAFLSSSIDHQEIITRLFPSPSEMSHEEENPVMSENKKHGGQVQNAAKRLKSLFRWLSMKKKRRDDDGYAESLKRRSSFNETPVSLREMCLRSSSMPNNKRTLSVRSDISSPINKKFASSVVQGNLPRPVSSPSSLSKTSISSCSSPDKGKGSDDLAGSSYSNEDESDESPRHMKLTMNQYLCFGGSGLSRIGRHERHSSNHNNRPLETVSCQ